MSDAINAEMKNDVSVKGVVGGVTQGLNPTEKITVTNLSPWDVSFARLETIGEVLINGYGSLALTRNEVILQINNGNKLFTGGNEHGNHATLIIQDAATKKELGYTRQLIVDKKAIASLFANTDAKKFATAIKRLVTTRSETQAVCAYMKDPKNKVTSTCSYDIIQIAKEHCRFIF